MHKHSYRTWAEIDLDAIRHNMREIRRHVGEKVKILACVKADAYGHGSVRAAQIMIESGADMLAVASIDEGRQLRDAGILCRILSLGYTAKADTAYAIEENITPTIYSFEDARRFSGEAKNAGKECAIHIALDTGMTRIGFELCDKALDEIEEINNLENIKIEGIYTHFSCADGKDDSFTELQFKRFCDFVKNLELRGITIPVKHVCNSAATIKHKNMHLDMVRPGIICYGLMPSDEVDRKILDLKPAMSVKTIVTRIQYREGNVPVSYGATYVTSKKTKIATLPIGYADGFMRALSGKWQVIIDEKRVPVIGRICMDQCMIDVSSVNNICEEDVVTVFGECGNASATFDEAAEILNTISYELICAIGKRVPRIYSENGKITGFLSYLG